ncbi:hypothetical protein MRX96_020798 [Rhipicephalus microplus]
MEAGVWLASLDEGQTKTSVASRRFYHYRAHSEKTRPKEGSDSGTSAIAQPCKRPGETHGHPTRRRKDQTNELVDVTVDVTVVTPMNLR